MSPNDHFLLLYFWASPDGAQQLGAVAHSGGSVVQRGGELGRLGGIALLVLGRLVVDTWRKERGERFSPLGSKLLISGTNTACYLATKTLP